MGWFVLLFFECIYNNTFTMVAFVPDENNGKL